MKTKPAKLKNIFYSSIIMLKTKVCISEKPVDISLRKSFDRFFSVDAASNGL